ncbi:prolipoprotein diacylglyceryl transferase [Spirochaetota bacterium]
MFPVHLNLGFTVLYFYEGLYFAISVIIGYSWSKRRVTSYYDSIQYENFIFWIVVGLIIGGRISHFVFWENNVFLDNPLEIFKFWQGGISVIGGIIGGITAAIVYCRLKKFDFWYVFALASPALLLAQGVGRIGCFLNGDAFGINTNMPWGIKLPKFGMMLPSFETIRDLPSYAWSWSFQRGLVDLNSQFSVPLHPAQLYEAAGDFFLMTVILLILKLKIDKDRLYRFIFFVYVLFYSTLRFIIEFFRADRKGISSYGLSDLQFFLGIISFVSIIFIIYVIFIKNRKTREL